MRRTLARGASSQTVEGVDNLSSIFEVLGNKAIGRVIRSAANTAMTPVLKQARANANFQGHEGDEEGHFVHSGKFVKKGFTKRSVIKKVSQSRDKNRVFVAVGVASDAYYAVSFIERGYKAKDGSTVPAQPWLVPAFEANKANIINIVNKKVSAGIEKETKRYRTRGRQS